MVPDLTVLNNVLGVITHNFLSVGVHPIYIARHQETEGFNVKLVSTKDINKATHA